MNKVKPNMSSAKLYLSSNVVDRLTRPIAADDAEGDGTAAAGHGGVSRGGSVDGSAAGAEQMFDSSYDRPVMDMASFMGSLDRKGSFSTPGGVGAGAKPRAASARRGAAPMTAEEKQHRQEQFQAFLSRQNYVVKKKQEQIKQVYLTQALMHICMPTYRHVPTCKLLASILIIYVSTMMKMIVMMIMMMIVKMMMMIVMIYFEL